MTDKAEVELASRRSQSREETTKMAAQCSNLMQKIMGQGHMPALHKQLVVAGSSPNTCIGHMVQPDQYFGVSGRLKTIRVINRPLEIPHGQAGRWGLLERRLSKRTL